MDVEKLKKMNELSKELKKHGIADSTKQAFAQAGEMVRDEAVGDVITRSGNSEKSKDSFDSQYQIMLERQNRQMASEIKALKETVAAIQEELKQLKCADFKARTPEQRQEPSVEKQATLQKKEEKHPKQGDFNSDDVAVDKIFYYGKK